MLDFLIVSTRVVKSVYEIYPRFIVKKSDDLMIKGHDFYAIWVQERGLWSTDEFEAFALIDQELDIYFNKNKDNIPPNSRILHMWDADSGMVDKWHRFCQNQMRDNFVMLDETIIFADMETKREDYASRKLSYSFGGNDISAWDRIVGTLYDESERFKIEWAIGAIVSGASKSLQKFFVFYGGPGTGKSTILNIIQRLFEDYATTFRAKDLTTKTNAFALEAFRSNPLVSIEHDGDLSRIEDNTTLNSLVSHEPMLVNEKYKSTYTSRFWTLLFIGTNKPVKITDSKSGLLRRLIDIHPNEKKLDYNEYVTLMSRVEFELGGIVEHCLDVYRSNPAAFNEYVPLRMMEASNDLYNFFLEHYYAFEKSEGVSLRDAWEMYKQYCEDSNVSHPMTKRVFKEEMRLYFKEYYERNPDGRHQLDWYKGFKKERFESKVMRSDDEQMSGWLRNEDLIEQHSLLDDAWASCKAQYATEDGTPSRGWDLVKTSLSDLDTSKLHYVQNPEDHIVIDCDLGDKNGNKNIRGIDANIKFALSLPPTYCELSKGGGLHLHYIYSGNVDSLANVLAPGIEIKKRSGNSAIRRKLTRCNALPIAIISSGLPLKGEKKKMVNVSTIKNENALRKLIIKNLNKEVHPDTRSSIDFIKHLLDQAYESGMNYDLRDLQNDIYNFASRSTNQSEYCLRTCLDMKFCSDEEHLDGVPENTDAPFCFFDIEIFPNVFILVWKLQGDENKPVVLINPDPSLVREFCTANMRRIGFNCRRYDNHLIYAYAYRNYSVEDLYRMSQAIINSKISKYFIGEAYNLSYTDVYDFASAGNKMSLKKLELKMGIHHQEFGHPWDQPLSKELWKEAADYCCNDVVATEKAFDYLHSDYLARVILADIADMLPNNTTNQLSMRIVFGNDRNPQSQFNYRDMSKPVRPDNPIITNMGDRIFTLFDDGGNPTGIVWDGNDIPEGWSLLPFFPDYTYEFGKSTYRGTLIGEGGYVYAKPGMYRYVPLLDIMSMHPSSIIAECLFGPKYTKRFQAIVDLRIDIKHGAFDEARQMFDGKLVKWLEDTSGIDGLSDALKTVINSAYGLTSASFENLFRDPRNIDNIVAKRGALFMRNLQSEVEAREFTVAHIKTDSIKIPKATPELIDFVMEYGRAFGYNFEYEACYDCVTLVNDAVYIARYDAEGIRNKGGKKAGEWTATGAQFAVPYVFKTLFTHEDLEFNDLCETFSVQSALCLDINEKLEDVTQYEKELKKLDPKDPSAAARISVLKEKIDRGHNYCFVGRCSQFCPMQEGNGGGYLYRMGKNKYGETTYSFVAKTSGRRWMESETVRTLGLEDKIDMTYFEELAQDAIEAIEKYGEFAWFSNHDLNDPHDEIFPF